MRAYQLKVQIKDSHPPIWRRVIVPAGLSFSQLSILLNKTMGWCGYHLFEFEFYHLGMCIKEEIEETEEYVGWGEEAYETADAAETMIDSYLDTEDWFTYTYDLGDNWNHRVTIESRLEDYDKNYAQVLKYKGETPYEDCGGIDGYYSLMETLADPSAPEHEAMKEWTDQHFTEKYDLEDVNDDLTHLFLSNAKSGPMSQDEIYREIYEEELPFKKIESGNRYGEGEEYTLKGILECYKRADLIEIAKLHHLRTYSKYNKEELMDFLCGKLLSSEVMCKYFQYLSDDAAALLEQDELVEEIGFGDERFNFLVDGGYAGYINLGFMAEVVVSTEVRAAYKMNCGKNWKKSRKGNLRLLHHLNAAAELNGVCSIEIALQIYEQNTKCTGAGIDIPSLCKEIPDNIKRFVVRDGQLVLKELNDTKTIQSLLKEQEGKSLYMPGIQEVETLGSAGYVLFDKYMNQLQNYFINMGEEERAEAKRICQKIQYIIRTGGSIQEVMDELDEECSGYDILMATEKSANELMGKLNEVWNHTRMISNRGHMPAEIIKPDVRGEGSENKIISFPVSGRKKIYPNDPCPCGSGKKYKHCCGSPKKEKK